MAEAENWASRPSPDTHFSTSWLNRLLEVNKELWLIFTIFLVSLIVNYVVSSQRLMLNFYALPTVFSAYFFGRRHATMTAVFSGASSPSSWLTTISLTAPATRPPKVRGFLWRRASLRWPTSTTR